MLKPICDRCGKKSEERGAELLEYVTVGDWTGETSQTDGTANLQVRLKVSRLRGEEVDICASCRWDILHLVTEKMFKALYPDLAASETAPTAPVPVPTAATDDDDLPF